MTRTMVAPPPDYPHETWTEDEADPFYVPTELRDDYAQAFATVEMYAAAAPVEHEPAGHFLAPDGRLKTVTAPTDRPVPFDVWQHRTRYTRARSAAAGRERQAEYDRRYLRTCPCCGQRTDTSYWQQVAAVRTRSAHATDTSVPRTPSLRVCEVCAPLVAHALRAVQRLDDGRTREDAATEYAGRLLREAASA